MIERKGKKMKLTRDAFRSDVLELSQGDLDSISNGCELTASGLVVRKMIPVVDKISIAIADKAMTRDGLTMVVLPLEDYKDLDVHISTTSSTCTKRLTSDGTTNFMGMRIYRYEGNKIIVV
jgi:hypothetical protein